MKMKQIVACAALVAASGVAAPAYAGASANVGLFSSYMFRGVNQNPLSTDLTAIQGGLDYAHDSGLYVGTWLSNIDFKGYNDTVTYETDFYGGYTFKAGEVGLDVGALHYYYADDSKLDTTEFYVGATYGPVTGKVFYTSDYFGTDKEGYYYTVSGSLPVMDGFFTVGANVGYSVGDGPKNFVTAVYETDSTGTLIGTPEDAYIDYGVTISKSFDPGYTFSLAFIGSNLDGAASKEQERVVFGVKKVFSF